MSEPGQFSPEQSNPFEKIGDHSHARSEGKFFAAPPWPREIPNPQPEIKPPSRLASALKALKQSEVAVLELPVDTPPLVIDTMRKNAMRDFLNAVTPETPADKIEKALLHTEDGCIYRKIEDKPALDTVRLRSDLPTAIRYSGLGSLSENDQIPVVVTAQTIEIGTIQIVFDQAINPETTLQTAQTLFLAALKESPEAAQKVAEKILAPARERTNASQTPLDFDGIYTLQIESDEEITSSLDGNLTQVFTDFLGDKTQTIKPITVSADGEIAVTIKREASLQKRILNLKKETQISPKIETSSKILEDFLRSLNHDALLGKDKTSKRVDESEVRATIRALEDHLRKNDITDDFQITEMTELSTGKDNLSIKIKIGTKNGEKAYVMKVVHEGSSADTDAETEALVNEYSLAKMLFGEKSAVLVAELVKLEDHTKSTHRSLRVMTPIVIMDYIPDAMPKSLDYITEAANDAEFVEMIALAQKLGMSLDSHQDNLRKDGQGKYFCIDWGFNPGDDSGLVGIFETLRDSGVPDLPTFAGRKNYAGNKSFGLKAVRSEGKNHWKGLQIIDTWNTKKRRECYKDLINYVSPGDSPRPSEDDFSDKMKVLEENDLLRGYTLLLPLLCSVLTTDKKSEEIVKQAIEKLQKRLPSTEDILRQFHLDFSQPNS